MLPIRCRANVDLPAPFGPTIAYRLLAGMLRLTSRRACRPVGNVYDKCEISIAAPVPCVVETARWAVSPVPSIRPPAVLAANVSGFGTGPETAHRAVSTSGRPAEARKTPEI